MAATESRQRDTTTATGRSAVRTQADLIASPAIRRVLAVGRIVIGFTFLWAFLDKLFGLNYNTPPEAAWINGGSPAQGFINGIDNATSGFFGLFANTFGDAMFMIGLAGIGLAMVLGAGLRIAAVGGLLLMVFMYLATFPTATAVIDGELVRGATNPILTSHWHEGLLLAIAALTLAGDTWGLGRWWGSTALVQRLPWLR